jgi:hypothetical protein
MPLAMVLASFTVFDAMQWLENGWARWAYIAFLAAAISLTSTPAMSFGQRALRGLWVGIVISLLVVGLSLGVGWIEDRPHFFDDGGPLAALLIIGFYVGLPTVALATVLSTLSPMIWPVPAKQSAT